MTRMSAVLALATLLLAGCQAASTSPGSSVPASLPGTPQSFEPSAAPSLSPRPSPTPEAQPDALAPGSTATVLVDLLLREEPGLGAPVRTKMAGGEMVYLIGPPFEVSADGYTWRLVSYAAGYHAWPLFPDKTWFSGWAAASGPEGLFLRPLRASCPDEPITLAKVLALPDWDRARCFGNRELTISGQIITGFGGYVPGTFDPEWLASPLGAGAVGIDEGYLFYYERHATPYEQGGGRIELTGHFNDLAAQRCSMAVGEPPDPQPKDLAVMYCQGKLVVTATRLIDK